MSQGGEGKGKRVFEVQNDIGAKPFSSAVRGKFKGEKKNIGEPSELSGSLGTREKGPRDLFMPFHSIFSHFFPTAEPGQGTISL